MSLSKSVVLADPTQRVPWPGVPGRFVPADEAIEVSVIDPFWSALITDRTLIDAPAKPAAKAKT